MDVEAIDIGNFMERINEALEACEWLIVVLTPDALASEYVRWEVNSALRRVMQGSMCAVIPVLAKPCPEGSIPPTWDALQRFDCTSDYGAGLAGVLRVLGLPAQVEVRKSDSDSINVFVSHSHKDRDITQRLVADLHKAGAEVWEADIDGIQSGNVMQAIDEALAQCDWMVLVLSPSALASKYVPEETHKALHRVKQGKMKGVIPVLVTACQPGTIPPQWEVLQHYDVTQGYDAALAGVSRLLGLFPPVQQARS